MDNWKAFPLKQWTLLKCEINRGQGERDARVACICVYPRKRTGTNLER